ncbi:MAG: endopeptidase La [Elusimicrobia bacterium CG1_02_37_114]|nr:MAG: endopeptidase La [Elusimicrobia bacterium CG1_02_37_114]PIZ14170.1 MAG: endopeptidase La [Elusimicrobia bacterium CG_4_10_14_0_8_um_filter_37_32]
MIENFKKQINIPQKLPLLPVRDVVVFPTMVTPLAVGREKSVKAVEDSMSQHKLIFISTQKKVQVEDPAQNDIYEIGIIAEVLQLLKMSDGTLKVLVEGIKRGRLLSFKYLQEKNYVEVEVETIVEQEEETPELEALKREAHKVFAQYVKINRRLPLEISAAIINIEDSSRLSDIIASHLTIKLHERQILLETISLKERMVKIVEILNREIEILNIERRIQGRVKTQIEKTQKEYYLSEQMKAIQKELHQKDDFAKEIDELRTKIKQAKMTKEAQETSEKELQRLEKMMPFSPEATVIRTYLDWLINLPWAVTTQDNFDIKRAEAILEEDHYGLKKAKERVLEYLAVLKRVKDFKGPILCFVGPPGTGKTSLAKSIARALGRNFVRASLGGVRDEAEIRGHRRTYIGSLPGRIIQWMRKAKSKNPVFLLDEIDKMGMDWRGDPSAALLETLDPEQNNSFVDHYLDVEFDLSKVMFITTANTVDSIPPALVDRLEIIRFPGYTMDEKIKIAQLFLIPKQLKQHGLTEENVKITTEAIKEIMQDYTREAGVRNMEREIASIYRKVSKEIALQEKEKLITITKKNSNKYLGIPEFYREKVSPNDVGIATGLAWTEHGGETLTIEVLMLKGKGKYTLTGKLGEVMRESAQASLSYVRSISKLLNINEKIFKDRDFHIHVPEGAIPKDGPSAGITIATAIASIVTNRPIKKDLAMTGEITLRGRVLTIGGFKEKVIAAYRENIKTIIFPEGNKKDLKEIPKKIQHEMKLMPVRHMSEVFKISLEKFSAERTKRETEQTFPESKPVHTPAYQYTKKSTN